MVTGIIRKKYRLRFMKQKAFLDVRFTCLLWEGTPIAMAMFLDVRSEDLIFLGSPRTLLQSHLFTTRSSHHVCGIVWMAMI